jgi:hypothetical protein
MAIYSQIAWAVFNLCLNPREAIAHINRRDIPRKWEVKSANGYVGAVDDTRPNEDGKQI